MSRIEWPQGFDRTDPRHRETSSRFQASIAGTAEDIETEMDRLSPRSWRVDTGSGGSHTRRNGLPKHSANPDDPGVVLRWEEDAQQFAVACDHYTTLRDNLRTVYLWVHETRMRGQRPVVTGESEFAAARLPPADETAHAPAASPDAPHEVLDVSPDADPGIVQAAYRMKLKQAHPDQGGSRTAVERVRSAKEAMLDE